MFSKPEKNLPEHSLLTKLYDLSQQNKERVRPEKNMQLYKYFLFKKPINLLFSIDQFLFEFGKKQPQQRKSSEFQQKLKERKKLTLFYGNISKKQLCLLSQQALTLQGSFSKNFFGLLEQRLDVVLYRSQFAKTIPGARQFITHGKVLLNNQIATSPSHQVHPGDVISIPSGKISLDHKLLTRLETSIKKRYFISTISQNLLHRLETSPGYRYGSRDTLREIVWLLLKKIDVLSRLEIIQTRNGTSYTLLSQNPKGSRPSRFQAGKPLFQYRTKGFNSPSRFKARPRPLKGETGFPKKSQALYRILLFDIIISMRDEKRFHHLFLLKLKKNALRKRPLEQYRRVLGMVGFKPLNLEISYQIFTMVFLYSPQRLWLPFYMDIDLIRRSLQ